MVWWVHTPAPARVHACTRSTQVVFLVCVSKIFLEEDDLDIDLQIPDEKDIVCEWQQAQQKS